MDDDLVTFEAQANKQAGGVATEGVTNDAKTTANEMYESIFDKFINLFICLFIYCLFELKKRRKELYIK